MPSKKTSNETPFNRLNSESGIIEYLQTSAANFPEGPIQFRDIVSVLGSRSFGLAILVFSLPMILPMPPGIPMAAGCMIGVFAGQLILGRDSIWLPTWLNEKTINRDMLLKGYGISERYLGWMFRLAKPRLPQLTGLFARRLAGLFCIILAILMILPIPIIGNILPAFACTVLALGLTDRDGFIYLIGIITAGLAISATVLMAIGTLNLLGAAF